MSFKLYPFQEQAINKSIESYSKKEQKDLIVIPTGCGKTRVISETGYQIYKNNPDSKHLFIAHRDFLIQQGIEEFQATIPKFNKNKFGVFNATSKEIIQPFIFASKDSLHYDSLSRYFSPLDFDTIYVDEAHHCHNNAISYMRVLDYFINAKVYGYTATPASNRGRLSEVFGKQPLIRVFAHDMIKQGFLCTPCCVRVKTNCDLKNVRKSINTEDGLNQKDLENIINVEKRNELIVDAYEDLLPGHSCIVFALNKRHVENLYQAFKKRGHAVDYIIESTPAEKRKEITNKLKNDELKIIINCTILTEGYNVPSLQSIIITRPIASIPLFEQIVGRVLRQAPGKTIAKIVIISDKPGIHKLATAQHILDGIPDVEIDPELRKEKNIDDLAKEYEEIWLNQIEDIKVESYETQNLLSDSTYDWMYVDGIYTLYLDKYKKIDLIPTKDNKFQRIYTDTADPEILEWAKQKAEIYINNLPIDISKVKKDLKCKQKGLSKIQKKKLASRFSRPEQDFDFMTHNQYGKLHNILFNKKMPFGNDFQRKDKALKEYFAMRKKYCDNLDIK